MGNSLPNGDTSQVWTMVASGSVHSRQLFTLRDQFWTVEAADFFGLEDYLLRICTGRFFLLALLILVPLIFGRVESLSPFLWRCRCRSISLRMRHFLVSSIMATWNCISSIASACRISVTSARGAYRWIWSKLVLS